MQRKILSTKQPTKDDIKQHMEAVKMRQELTFITKRLEASHIQLELMESFLSQAQETHEKYNLDTRRLKKLQEVLPKMRAVITRELKALLPD